MAEIKVPELAESIMEGTIAQWMKKPGDYVEKGEYIVELETDKVNVEIISEEAGVVQELKAAEGDTVLVGEVIAIVEAGSAAGSTPEQEHVSEAEPAKAEAAPVPAPEQVEERASERTIASPAARKLAREKGIKLSDVPTIDPLGRVRKQDVTSFSNQPQHSMHTAPAPQAAPVAIQDDSKPVERVRMSRRRQTIAKRLVEVQQNAAMLTTLMKLI